MEKGEMTKPKHDDEGVPFGGVPEALARGLVWDWGRGQLEFRYLDVDDEKARLLSLSDWLNEGDNNVYLLAKWMQELERRLESTSPR
jgi:hypothetical protein